MVHLLHAARELNNEFVNVDGKIVSFIIQDGPIGEVGANGCQAEDILKFVKHLFESLDNAYPCKENGGTITAIDAALRFQEDRTKDRENRGVEGKSEM